DVTDVDRHGDRLAVAGTFLGASPPDRARGGFSVHDDVSAARVLDTAYVAGDVFALASDGADGYYIGGEFRRVGSVARSGLARILAYGSVDPAFNPTVTRLAGGAPGSVHALARAGNGCSWAAPSTR
ncbi:MAG TPA: hypothetical protein VMO26_05295, partial [Vicinamibacterales bacterium]|nr:hypothetical protein [Vicinamibacterales bacterium]